MESRNRGLSGLRFMVESCAVQAQAGRPVIPVARPPVVQPNQPPAGQPNQQQPSVPRMNGAVPNRPPTAPLKPLNNGVDGNAQPAVPASPPQVTYRDGLLTVQASNSTLGSVLTAIRNKTGIEFEGQENVVSDRVALSLGPAPAGEVLSAMFAGSKFDFVAIGRQDDPGIVQRVILTPKTQPGAAAATNQPQPRAAEPQEGEGEETPDETPNVEPQPEQPAVQQQQPQAQPQAKTPEQLLQELQEMRKQQQQQQEGAPAPNPGHVPRKIPP